MKPTLPIDMLPPGWAQATLGELGDWCGGGTPSKSNRDYWSNGTIPWVSPKDMKRPRISSTEDYITNSAVRASATKLLPRESVLVVTRSGILAHSLPAAVTDVEVTLNQDMKGLVPNGSVVPEYVLALLQAKSMDILENCSKSGTTVSSIEFSRFLQYGVPLPPLNEQRRIVAKIEELTARSRRAREALDAIPALLDRFRQSVLAAAFRGDLTANWRAKNPDVEPASVLLDQIRQEQAVFQGARRGRVSRIKVASEQASRSALYELPDSWELVPLGEVASIQSGYAFDSKTYVSSGVRLLRGVNIVPGGTRWTDTVCLPPEQASEFQDFVLCDGDVVIAMDRPIISTGIKVARLSQPDLPALLLQRVGRFKKSKYINSLFLYYFLQSKYFMEYIGKQAAGTQLPHISANDIETVMFPVPPISEQNLIVDKLESLYGMLAAVSEVSLGGNGRLDRLEQSILSKAFRGELVPQDPNDEPASILLDRIRAEQAESVVPKAKRGRKPRVLTEA